jgi:hypothetical protein
MQASKKRKLKYTTKAELEDANAELEDENAQLWIENAQLWTENENAQSEIRRLAAEAGTREMWRLVAARDAAEARVIARDSEISRLVAVAQARAERKLARDALAEAKKEAAAAERAEAAAAAAASRTEWPGYPEAPSGQKLSKDRARKHEMVIHLMQQLMPVLVDHLGVNCCSHSTLVSTLSMASPSSTHYGVRPLTCPTRVSWQSMLEARDPDPNDLRSWWADTMWGTVSHAVTRSMHPPPPYHPPTHSRFSKW